MKSEESFHVYKIKSNLINNGELRLNASSYPINSIRANKILANLKSKDYTIKKLGVLSTDIFIGARSKRIFTSKKEGLPYLQPKEIFNFNLKPTKWISLQTDDVENWGVSPFMILVTQSGSIGRPLITNNLFDDKIISQNVIRFAPNREGRDLIGYIYAYLSTWIGQSLLMRDKFGITVKHIEDYHLANLSIPYIPDFANTINNGIIEAHELREQSQRLFMEAENLLYSDLLYEIDEEDAKYFDGNSEVKSFTMKSSELGLRLDASYHVPLGHLAVDVLHHLETEDVGNLKKLKDISDSFVPGRFKRIYVKSEEGVPLLQGTHVPLIKPIGIKSIWNKMKNLDNYVIEKDWILVTCSGTIGRLSLVSDYWNGWTATNHLLRIIPKKEEIHPGYLTAFLLSTYGQIQFQRLVYGGVVDEIGEAGELIKDILILKPKNYEIENKIGDLISEAYNKRDEATQIEEMTIQLLEDKLIELAEDN